MQWTENQSADISTVSPCSQNKKIYLFMVRYLKKHAKHSILFEFAMALC